ncbi:hypothetical protein TNCV_3291741 [Trichonephila clavipes]|nr:hypothetical protein TNCV_3291741 [Trichonephila clavipes]
MDGDEADQTREEAEEIMDINHDNTHTTTESKFRKSDEHGTFESKESGCFSHVVGSSPGSTKCLPPGGTDICQDLEPWSWCGVEVWKVVPAKLYGEGWINKALLTPNRWPNSATALEIIIGLQFSPKTIYICCVL